MSDLPSPPKPPEADLPGRDDETHRPMRWPWMVLILAGALAIPLMMSRCVFSGRTGTPTPMVRVERQDPEPGETAGVPVPGRRLALEEVVRVQEREGRAAAMDAFETGLIPFRPSPMEWTYYIALAQDEGRASAAERGLEALGGLAIEPWRLPLLHARQALRNNDLDRAFRQAAQVTEHLRGEPHEMIPLAEEVLAQVAGSLLLARRPREAAQILSERLSKERPNLFRLRLQALMMDGRAREAEDWLLRDRQNFGETERQRLLASARWADQRADAATVAWDAAFTLARTHGNEAETLALAIAARLAGDRARAWRAFEPVVAGPMAATLGVEAWTDVVALLVESDNLAAAQRVAGQVVRRFPDSFLARHNDAYLRLVLGLATEAEMVAWLEGSEAVALPARALAAVRLGRPEQAMALLKAAPAGESEAAVLAIEAMALRAQGATAAAQATASAARAAPDFTAIEAALLR